MPPTFFIFLGAIAYIGLTTVTCIVFVPMLFIDRKKLLAKKVLATVLISFPCLLVMGLLCALIFVLPALLFSWLANNGYIPRTPGLILAIIGTLTFAVSVATSSLYLWYFISKIIYHRLYKKSVADFLDSDKVFRFLRPYLIKFKVYSPAVSDLDSFVKYLEQNPDGDDDWFDSNLIIMASIIQKKYDKVLSLLDYAKKEEKNSGFGGKDFYELAKEFCHRQL